MTYEIQDGCRWCICIVHRKNSSFEFTAATAYDAIRSVSPWLLRRQFKINRQPETTLYSAYSPPKNHFNRQR